MDPYDTQAVRKIWQRVKASQEELLSAMLTAEIRSRDSYERLSRIYPPFRKALARMAEEEARHVKELLELYESLYGPYNPTEKDSRKTYPSLRRAIEDRHAAEEDAAQSYQKLACHFAAYRELFEALAKEEQHHTQQLKALLKQLPDHPTPSQGKK